MIPQEKPLIYSSWDSSIPRLACQPTSKQVAKQDCRKQVLLHAHKIILEATTQDKLR